MLALLIPCSVNHTTVPVSSVCIQALGELEPGENVHMVFRITLALSQSCGKLQLESQKRLEISDWSDV